MQTPHAVLYSLVSTDDGHSDAQNVLRVN